MVKNLKKLRIKYHMSQQQVAAKIGVSQQSINKYENQNVEPDIESMIELADMFNTSIDYLVGNTNIERRIEEVSEYSLNDDEAALIDSYRMLPRVKRECIDYVISVLADKDLD